MSRKSEPLTWADVAALLVLAVLIILCLGYPDLLDAIIARVGAA